MNAICPECTRGTHRNCDGTVWDPDRSEITTCACDQKECA